MTSNTKAALKVTVEEHRNCGGRVRLTHETWDCDRCLKRGVPITEVDLVEVVPTCTTTTLITKDTP